MPASYAKRLIDVMKDLQRARQESKVFAGKSGYITPRDLFRWGDRQAQGYQELAEDGYRILAESLRRPAEKEIVKLVLEKHMKVKIDEDRLYEYDVPAFMRELRQRVVGATDDADAAGSSALLQSLEGVVWTRTMRRLFSLVGRCLLHSEPVLLVGETGCGKTTVCELLGLVLQTHLYMVNCHQHTETADFLGGFRPVRAKEETVQSLTERLQTFRAEISKDQMDTGSDGLPSAETGALPALLEFFDAHKAAAKATGGPLSAIVSEIEELSRKANELFSWYDGPLITAMKRGEIILVDEISLAEDAVLERLNSVLEPGRTLLLAEKGGLVAESITAHPHFRFLATMNPGGDFGKRELSPALRNRCTEIWVDGLSESDEVSDRSASAMRRIMLSGCYASNHAFWLHHAAV